MKAVLCIGGLDPSGRAGLLADARAVTAMGCRPLCVATALTFQSSKGMDGYHAVDAAIVSRQLSLLLRDEDVASIKVGQLASAETATLIGRLETDRPIVVDTPLRASSGAELFPLAELAAYDRLLARAALVTPNADEALLLASTVSEVGSGLRARPAMDLDDAPIAASGTHFGSGTEARPHFIHRAPLTSQAAAEILAQRARAVLLKGGHIHGDTVTDTLIVGDHRQDFSGPRVPGRFRGTGCRLASAISARLACGDALPTAVGAARDWLQTQLRSEA